MFITNKAIYVTNIISSAHTIYLFFSRYKKQRVSYVNCRCYLVTLW
ncbi:hypothetical protein G3854_004625 [Escherichia coli]|nr:hypothetical protein [Escherichia coli]